MSRYVLASSATSDLDAIWEHIAKDNPDAADRWIARLFDAFETIAQTPGIGHSRPDLTAEAVLFWLLAGRGVPDPLPAEESPGANHRSDPRGTRYPRFSPSPPGIAPGPAFTKAKISPVHIKIPYSVVFPISRLVYSDKQHPMPLTTEETAP